MGKLPKKKKLGQFRSPGAEQYFLRKKNMDRSIDLAVQQVLWCLGSFAFLQRFSYFSTFSIFWQFFLSDWLSVAQGLLTSIYNLVLTENIQIVAMVGECLIVVPSYSSWSTKQLHGQQSIIVGRQVPRLTSCGSQPGVQCLSKRRIFLSRLAQLKIGYGWGSMAHIWNWTHLREPPSTAKPSIHSLSFEQEHI